LDIFLGRIPSGTPASVVRISHPPLRLSLSIPRRQRENRLDRRVVSPRIENGKAVGHDDPRSPEGKRDDFGISIGQADVFFHR
jgi:hypothetical protein